MLNQLRHHLQQNLPFLRNSKLLLAVSSGIDSIVMAVLFKTLGYEIALAHCNFKLRGSESDGDENFVNSFAEINNISVHTTRFNTVSFASDNKVSVQMAARQLRYSWFNELVEKHNYDYLLTAHHLDDQIETFLINFTRGTGLEGLTGIPQQNGRVVRPLLPFSRTEIEQYAQQEGLQWREDSSNASDKYLRNKLRHDVVPVLKTLNKDFGMSFASTTEHLHQALSLVQDAAVIVYKEVVTEKENQKHINLLQLLRLPNYKAYLYQWLHPFGFTAWHDIYSLVEAQPGKFILSEGFRLLKDRDVMILEPTLSETDAIYTIEEGQEIVSEPVNLRLQEIGELPKDMLKNGIYVNKQLIKFPLFVRKWQEGDYFYPFGMNGRKKKVSKFFKDEKMSLSDKENTWLLCSANDVVWIIGQRADERFKVTEQTTQILNIQLLSK
ncbi:tRNA lysidine(34) synthetase TilS [Flavobacterium sp. D11R37]|uniref:tRNA lysidine(34) synthetase TilS n=1 Tax=Flavobacterium coralii TaxID=2838017 RepID=UPI001CA6AD35|nr:tRNA lysidine(34) synthetase TilS [Flavobacterium coralii]MBY8961594.1 tRNA lysidine(34) synthetase TilS [Flavobacterium coralii]